MLHLPCTLHNLHELLHSPSRRLNPVQMRKGMEPIRDVGHHTALVGLRYVANIFDVQQRGDTDLLTGKLESEGRVSLVVALVELVEVDQIGPVDIQQRAAMKIRTPNESMERIRERTMPNHRSSSTKSRAPARRGSRLFSVGTTTEDHPSRLNPRRCNQSVPGVSASPEVDLRDVGNGEAENQRPDQAQYQLEVAVDDVLSADVVESDSAGLDELEGLENVFAFLNS